MLVSKRTAADSLASLVTAIQTEWSEPITVYPNPASDEFMLTAGADISAIRVLDLLGRERLVLEPVRRGETISFGRKLHPGPYLLCIDYETGERRVVKLIKN